MVIYLVLTSVEPNKMENWLQKMSCPTSGTEHGGVKLAFCRTVGAQSYSFPGLSSRCQILTRADRSEFLSQEK